MIVFDAAFDGEQCIGARFRPAVPDDLLACAFHVSGSDRQSALPVDEATYSLRVCHELLNAGRGFRPSMMRATSRSFS